MKEKDVKERIEFFSKIASTQGAISWEKSRSDRNCVKDRDETNRSNMERMFRKRFEAREDLTLCDTQHYTNVQILTLYRFYKNSIAVKFMGYS